MKLIAGIIVYNDDCYLEQAILACKDNVDELIIVEGAFQCTLHTNGKRNDKTERSNDKTLEIINKYVDNKKIFLKQINLQEHKNHYQVALDFAKERKGNYFMMIDSDEIWTKQGFDLLKSKLKMADKQGIFEYRVRAYCFISDFNHYYNGEYPRIFKVTPKAEFLFDNEVAWSDFNKHQDMGKVQGHIQLLSNQPLFYHYSYVRSKYRWQLKQDCLIEKDGNPINNQYKLEGDKYIIPSDIPIYEFNGQHPKIMQSHKFYGKTANEIIYGKDDA